MTIFGPDLSSYQQGIDVTALTDPFVILKATEGTYYADPAYAGWLAQAQSSGKIAIAYHFVRSDEDPDAQAAWIAEHIGDARLPLMLDVETTGVSKPTLPQVIAVVDRCLARGLRPKLAYIPRWYWQQIGSPDLTPLAARGVGLISSAYPGGTGTAAALYPGDDADGWQPYGGLTSALYQFSSQASDGGRLVDMNAWRGTADELRTHLEDSGDLMASYTMSDGWTKRVYPDLAPVINGQIPIGTSVPVEQAALAADVRGVAAAEYARQARDHGASSDSKLDQVLSALAALKTAPTVPIDLDTLAALIATHQTAGSTADVVAAAVLHHLSAATANG